MHDPGAGPPEAAPGDSASRGHTQGLAGAPAGCPPTHYRHHTTELESPCKCLDNVMVYDPQSGGTGGLHASPLLVCGPQAHNSSRATAQLRARALPCMGGGLGERPAPPPCGHSDSFTQGVSRSPGNRLPDNSVPWSPWQQSRPLVSRETKPSASQLPQQRLWVQSATLSCQLRGAAGRPGQRSQVLPGCGASARTQVPAQPGSQVEGLGPKSPCFL